MSCAAARRSAIDAAVGLESDDAGDWIDSTFELRSGLTVIEHPIDTLPGELQDAFKKR